jgi:hypothetical protein
LDYIHISMARLCVIIRKLCVCLLAVMACSVPISLYVFNNTAIVVFNISKLKGIRCSPRKLTDSIRKHVKDACNDLDSHNVSYWLDSGTLLGAVRNGDILPHDDDADIGYLWAERATVLKAVGSRFRIHGNIDLLRWSVSGNESTISRVNAPHETDLLNRLNVARWSGLASDWFLPTMPLGGTGALAHCKIPANPHTYLQLIYGSEYMNNVTCT